MWSAQGSDHEHDEAQGYTARIKFDERDSIFVVRVLGLRTMISFHGETVKELRKQLAVALDEFLQNCEQHGVRPEKPASGRILLRIPP